MRKIATAILLTVISCSSFAQTKTYEVRNGDTISAIADKFGVSQKELVQANALANSHKLKLGQKLTIPNASAKPRKVAQQAGPGTHVVRNGETDWSIAPKYGIVPSQLRQMNPDADWTNLKIGSTLRVPTRSVSVASASKAKPSATTVSSVKSAKNYTYCVKNGDNDWIIAKRFGISVRTLKLQNPHANWANLKIGTYIRVPMGASHAPVAKGTVAAASTSRIRSRYAVISKDNVRVRRGASTDKGVAVIVPQSTPVTVLDRQGDWYKCRFPRGTVGWVREDMLKEVKYQRVASSYAPAASSSKGSRTVASNRESSRVPRTSSNSTRKTVASYRPSAKAASSSSRRYSSQYTYSGGGDGDSKAVNAAMGMVGTRYRYGAMSRSATDCSGMVKQAYARAGVNLPRTSREMSTVGQSVSKNSLKAGDLVFFKTRGGRGVSHVGIYKGNGQFVHASSGKGHVTVSNLNDGYYSRTYAGAKRVASSSSSKSSTSAKKTTKPKPVVAKVDSEPKVEAPKVEAPAEKKSTNGTDEINP